MPGCVPQALQQLLRRIPMTGEAKGAQIFEITFSPALTYRENVVRIPKAFSRHGLQSEVIQHDLAAGATGSLQPAERFQRVDFAEGAAASITSEHLLAKIAGVGPQPPFVHTPVGTKCSPATWNFQRAPAAQYAAILAHRELGADGASTGHRSLRTHQLVR